MAQLKVAVMTPVQVLYTGEAESVSSVNAKGPFDVLDEHANFITIITQRLVIHGKEGDWQIPVSEGVMQVRENKVRVFLGINVVHE